MEFRTSIRLELDIFDQESPNFVTESVSLKMTLEGKSGLHSICENICDCLVEVEEDLHR